MVENLDNTKGPYNVIPYHNIPNQVPKISNSPNSVICQSRSLKFGMVVDLDNTYKLYHTIAYHNISSHTKYQIFQTVIVHLFSN